MNGEERQALASVCLVTIARHFHPITILSAKKITPNTKLPQARKEPFHVDSL